MKYNVDEVVKRWTEALRSGEYEQGEMALCDNGKYCCLGVLCDLYKDEFKLNLQTYGTETEFDGHSCSLPDVMQEAFGMTDLGRYKTENGLEALAADNDCGKTFAEISDIIEQNKESIFQKITQKEELGE